jgi:hypothetical protein
MIWYVLGSLSIWLGIALVVGTRVGRAIAFGMGNTSNSAQYSNDTSYVSLDELLVEDQPN